ncbi:MAG: hypothetical protein AB1523_02815 [Bacillota bacterium]
MYWLCGCGEQFPVDGFYGRLLTHRRKRKAEGNACPPIKGLFDGEGQRVAGSINEARALGLLEPVSGRKTPGSGGKTPGSGGNTAGAKVSSTIRAKMRFQDVELDPSLWILFDLARLKWPDDYDDTPESFAFWVAETIYTFYMEHAEELGFDILLAKSLKRLRLR